MTSKLHLIKVLLAMGMLLSCAIFFLGMNLLAGPGTVCWTNNDFSEYWPEVILMANGIIWGIGFLVWNVRNYMKQRPREKPAEDDGWDDGMQEDE